MACGLQRFDVSQKLGTVMAILCRQNEAFWNNPSDAVVV
jgi:hypothetical protein